MATPVDGPPARDVTTRVTELLLDMVLEQPLHVLLVPELHGRLLHAALRGYLERPTGAATAFLDGMVLWLREQPSVGAVVPEAVLGLLRDLARHPYMPDRALLVGILSRPPLRALARELMVGTLLDYSRKLRAGAVEPPAPGRDSRGGFGALGRLASEAVRKGGAAAMAIAPGVTTAVSDEFERQLQRRATEFADGAVDDLLQKAAATLTDPQRGRELIELKLALLDYVLALRGSDLARELERLGLPQVYALIRAAGLGFLQRETAEAELAGMLQRLRDRSSQKSLRAVLQDLGALAPLRAALLEFFAHATRPLIDSGALRRALED